MSAQNCSDLVQKLRTQLQPLLNGHGSLREAFGLEGEKLLYLAGMANNLAKQGKLMEAAILLAGLTLIEPANALLHSSLGAVLMKLQQPDSAANELVYAVRLNPNDTAARANLGEVLCQHGDIPGAIEHLQAAVLADASEQDAFANRARALLLLISSAAQGLQLAGAGAQETIKEEIRRLPSSL